MNNGIAVLLCRLQAALVGNREDAMAGAFPGRSRCVRVSAALPRLRGSEPRRSACQLPRTAQRLGPAMPMPLPGRLLRPGAAPNAPRPGRRATDRPATSCLLYTSDAADDLLCVDL